MNDHLPDGFQPGGRAWNPRRSDIAELLRDSIHATIQPIYYGSNHTFLVTLDGGEAGRSFGVYKPARGEYPLYDFPTGTLYQREVATWLTDVLLGWQLVPPTVLSTGRYGPGSLQIFIDAVDEGEVEVKHLQRLCLLDLVTNNADRKAEHCLLDAENSLWGIDHGLTFHAQPKLRTVLWHFAGHEIEEDELAALRRLHRELGACRHPETRQLSRLISRSELAALRQRTQSLLDTGRFPNPRYKPVPYRW